MSSYLEYVSCGSGGGGGDLLGFAPKFRCADARPVALQPAFPLGSGDGAFVSCLPLAAARRAPSSPTVPAQPPAPPYAPCTLESAYEPGAAPAAAGGADFLGPGPAYDFPCALGRPADDGGAHVHYATSAVFSGGGSLLLSGQADYAAFSEPGPFPACLKEPADGHSGAFQTASPAPGAYPKSASPASGLPSAFSTFEWMKVKRNAPKKSKYLSHAMTPLGLGTGPPPRIVLGAFCSRPSRRRFGFYGGNASRGVIKAGKFQGACPEYKLGKCARHREHSWKGLSVERLSWQNCVHWDPGGLRCDFVTVALPLGRCWVSASSRPADALSLRCRQTLRIWSR